MNNNQESRKPVIQLLQHFGISTTDLLAVEIHTEYGQGVTIECKYTKYVAPAKELTYYDKNYHVIDTTPS